MFHVLFISDKNCDISFACFSVCHILGLHFYALFLACAFFFSLLMDGMMSVNGRYDVRLMLYAIVVTQYTILCHLVSQWYDVSLDCWYCKQYWWHNTLSVPLHVFLTAKPLTKDSTMSA